MADRFIIIGQDEKSQCGICYQFFHPTSEYHKRCEQRTSFPPDFPKSAMSNPYAFCSEECERIAIEHVRQGRSEFKRALESE